MLRDAEIFYREEEDVVCVTGVILNAEKGFREEVHVTG